MKNDKGFKKTLQVRGAGLRAIPREKGDPNHLPTVTKINPNTDLPFGIRKQERDGITTEWLAQGDVKSVPASSNNINVYAEPSGREDEKRKKLLLLLLMPWKKVLQRQQPFERTP